MQTICITVRKQAITRIDRASWQRGVAKSLELKEHRIVDWIQNKKNLLFSSNENEWGKMHDDHPKTKTISDLTNTDKEYIG